MVLSATAVALVVLGAVRGWSSVSSGSATTGTTTAPNAGPRPNVQLIDDKSDVDAGNTTATPTLAPSVDTTPNPTTTTTTTTPTTRPSTYKPNLLFIVCDDLKPIATSFGAPPGFANTTNMDRLAARGTAFLNAHAQMANCSPSRASFLTSQRPDTLGLYDDNNNGDALLKRIQAWGSRKRTRLVTLPGALKARGWNTFGFGKVFHESETTLMRDPSVWTTPVFTFITKVRPQPSFGNPYVGSWISTGGVSDNDAAFPDGQMSRAVANLITTLTSRAGAGTGGQAPPWAVFVGFWKPHLPWQAPQKYFDALPPVEVYPTAHHFQVPDGLAQDDYQMIRGQGCLEVGAYVNSPNNLAYWTLTGQQEQLANRAYAAAVSFVDAQIGVVLDALDASVARDSTHVVLMGDHGFSLGTNGLWCKHTCMTPATRTPLVVVPALGDAWPRARGAVSTAPVELLDVLPTVMELMGIGADVWSKAGWAPPEGASLVPILNVGRDEAFVKAAAVSQYFRHVSPTKTFWGYALHTVRYRFTVWTSDEGFASKVPNFGQTINELYDLCADPYEQESLFSMDSGLARTFTAPVDTVVSVVGGGTAAMGFVQWSGATRFDALRGAAPVEWDANTAALARRVREVRIGSGPGGVKLKVVKPVVRPVQPQAQDGNQTADADADADAAAWSDRVAASRREWGVFQGKPVRLGECFRGDAPFI